VAVWLLSFVQPLMSLYGVEFTGTSVLRATQAANILILWRRKTGSKNNRQFYSQFLT